MGKFTGTKVTGTKLRYVNIENLENEWEVTQENAAMSIEQILMYYPKEREDELEDVVFSCPTDSVRKLLQNKLPNSTVTGGTGVGFTRRRLINPALIDRRD